MWLPKAREILRNKRKIESILLQERRKLIQSGTTSSRIKLRGTSLYVNNKKFGSVRNLKYAPVRNEEATTEPQEPTTNDQWLCNNTTVILWNACSLMNKLNQFQSVIYSKDLDVICITETWLNDTISSTEILPTSYTIYRNDRINRGVLIAVKESIPSQICSISNTIEMITVNFKC